MSLVLSSQGVVLATAMAVSGTMILLALRLQKSLPSSQFPLDQIPSSSQQVLRSCISSDRKKKGEKKERKVKFAKDVVDQSGDGEEFRKKHGSNSNSSLKNGYVKIREMPANRIALYNGILRARGVQKLYYS